MKARVWELKWAKAGVRIVTRDHAVAETNRTRSPPTLTNNKHYWVKTNTGFNIKYPMLRALLNCIPVAGMSSQDLCEAVTPEESPQNQTGIDFTPMKSCCHRHDTDRHGHPRTEQQAGAQKQHHTPFSDERSIKRKKWKQSVFMKSAKN